MSQSDILSTSRIPPTIRDHETIRMIGRGAYGEVWMARSVTGTLRAVKVVWREDYDYEESFEREFEALKRYEPVSRKHSGLVPILQIGRNDEEGFYYYVMELADDLEKGREIDPATYRPHTLGLEMRRDGRVAAEDCIKLGINVAEALHHLHQNNLIHRDVKPSNLIFIDGLCRLADIGLVALLGQRSFVGTEGFVAPEGPGSAASDIFSLGMVLYEASTGKDRLDFPDIPSTKETGEKLEVWRRLNEVICTACAPKARNRFENAREMSLALQGEALPSQRRRWHLALGGVLLLLMAVGLGMWLSRDRWTRDVVAVSKLPPLLTIRSDPPGAVVFSGDEQLGTTPLELDPPEDVPVLYQLRLPGYKHLEVEHIATSTKPVEFNLKLEPSKLPQIGEHWQNSLGMDFKPRQGGHVSVLPVEMKYFRNFLEASGRSFEGKVVRFQSGKEKGNGASYIVIVPPGDAEAFRFWMTDTDRAAGVLSQEHHYEIEPFYFVESGAPPPDELPDGRDPESTSASKEWQAFYLRVARQTYGLVSIRTNPPGVKVYQREELIGETPVDMPRVKSGPVEFELREEGFTDMLLDGEVKEGEMLELYADMEARTGVTFEREWRNGLGMRFVPLGNGEVMMSVWETRRRDYIEFTKATGLKKPGPPEEEKNRAGGQPIASVTRDEARAFCAWLTERERLAGSIGAKDYFRLPTDDEWSRAVGLPLERGTYPAERNGRIRGIYPWGFDWPPPAKVDNFADVNGARTAGLESVIPGYEDGFAYAAPVTFSKPNERGVWPGGQRLRVGGHGLRSSCAGHGGEWRQAGAGNGAGWQLAQCHSRGVAVFLSDAAPA